MTADNSTRPDNASPPRWLLRLERVPKAVIFIAVLVIALGILWTPGILGALLTTLVAAGAGFLLYATWHWHTAAATRLVRVLVVVTFAVLGIAKFFVLRARSMGLSCCGCVDARPARTRCF